ncbi:AAA family ATPase [Bacillus sp. 1NLA3E]|uniref:AAA family ATPase n=1 Tax=Bacillus sp. 1NLA3E TaxID=666686 RepID=UPI000247E66F|nr:AAA family ATPase [Bacillus sp. 1NLA3E]AGK52004.1 hypothetical protein B1NLA3E_01100 [Bacillus sp. 1NLA3E]
MVKQLRLLSLELNKFKGVPSFLLDARGENAKVYGDNATGKTTLFDAFMWLLFDKDSQNKKDFSIKTLVDGKEVHMMQHEVEGVFLLNGRKLTLKKVFAEKWTKKRGSITQEFTGHTTDYFVDGVPSKLKEYKTLVDSIVNENIFKLLTSPSYFNEQVKWQDKRKTLLEICGDISDEEVIASESSLSKLPAILQGKSIENHRKIIAARRTEINKEIEKIPVRIDEIKRNLPELDGLDKSELETGINQMNDEIDGKMTQIISIKNGNAITERQKAIQEIEMELLNIKRDHDSDSKDLVYQKKARIQEEQSNISLLKSKLNQVKNNKRYNDENIKNIENQLVQLRQEWTEVNNQEFSHADKCECPACGQSLPEQQVQEARDKALAQFNLSKAKKLEGISEKGKQGSERKQEFIQNNEKLTVEYDKLNGQISDKQTALEKLQEQLNQLEGNIIDINENPVYVAKLKEKSQINAEISDLRSMSDQAIQDIQSEIISLKLKREELQKDAGKFALADQSNNRIEELKQQERKLSAEFEKLEQELYLTEEFIRTKVNLLESKINSRFKYARFNLFKTNINGGLEEVCETAFNGVPYSSGLNNAAKINIGLDIINTLSEHYGFTAPIFIDNSEAVTKLIDTKSQTISLVVSEADKVLRVEHEGNIVREAV